MYAGTLIEDLMSTVERAEQNALSASLPQENLAELCVVSQFESMQSESLLAGVA